MVSVLSSDASSFEKQLNTISKTYGFLQGQKTILNNSKRNHPDLKADIRIAELSFKASFGLAENNLEIKLRDLLGNYYDEFMNSLDKEMANNSSGFEYDRKTTLAYIEEVKLRAEGYIESPFKEILLAYQYKDKPGNEFLDGFVTDYTTKGHFKAKGVDMQIKFPQSWKAYQGERPNIVQKFVSENGEGKVTAMIIITNIPQDELELMSNISNYEYFSYVETDNLIPPNSKFISRENVKLDRYDGVKLIYETSGDRMGYKIKMKTFCLMTIVSEKVVNLMFAVVEEDGGTIEEKFKKNESLFELMGFFTVFPEQYSDN